jgi:hypothetical protein
VSDTLVFFGTEPRLLGIATIGGILSLVFLVFSVTRSLLRYRATWFESVKSTNLMEFRLFLRENRMAVRMHALDISDVTIAERYWRLTFSNSLSFLMIMGLGILNAAMTSNGPVEVFTGSVSLLCVVASFGYLRAALNSANRAFQLVAIGSLRSEGIEVARAFKQKLRKCH